MCTNLSCAEAHLTVAIETLGHHHQHGQVMFVVVKELLGRPLVLFVENVLKIRHVSISLWHSSRVPFCNEENK